jgi:CheY-like chemotaxis protein
LQSHQHDILLVDDDPEDRMIMLEAFIHLNCHDRVTMYESGAAFHEDLEQISSYSPLPKLIVLDYNLPGEDGAELLALLKKDPVLCTIPVVIYTNGMSRTQEKDCMVKGAAKCFGKGSTYEEVVSFCKQVCDYVFSNLTLLEK